MESKLVRVKVLEMLPIIQQDIWKTLGLEHRQISKVVLRLEKDGLLIREKAKGNTYLLKPTEMGQKEQCVLQAGKSAPKKPAPEKKKSAPVKKPAPEKKVIKVVVIKKKVKDNRFEPLLSRGVFSPCTGCSVKGCEPTTCKPLDTWI